jgi:hypothetical protein
MEFAAATAHRARHQALVDAYTHFVSEVKNPKEWVVKFFVPDATFVIGNSPVSRGHDQIADGAARIYAVATVVRHVVTSVHSVDEHTCIAEGTVAYTINGKALDPLPICSVFSLAPGTDLIRAYQAYINNTPMFIAAGFDMTADGDGNPTMVPRKR